MLLLSIIFYFYKHCYEDTYNWSNKMTSKVDDIELPIILKSGSTDLRRQEKKLVELIENNYKGGIQYGVTYGFSNRNNTAIKLIVLNKDASVSMVKLKREKPYEWPTYQEKDKEGYVVSLEGETKQVFLKEIGYPNNP